MARFDKPHASNRRSGTGYGQQKRGHTSNAASPPNPFCQSPTAPRQNAGRAALIIFAKAPIPGTVKTRLCPPLTDEEAATLHGSLVLDVLERTQLPLDRFVACSPSADHVFFKILEERHGVRLLSQALGNLGDRMQHALQGVLDLGYRKAVVIGTDVPGISRPLLTQALDSLDNHEVVLGPAVDGGYYLIGLTHVVPELFADIPWSSDRVCAITVEKARGMGLTTALLPPQRDLDTVQDLRAALQELGTTREARDDRQETDASLPSAPLASRLSKRTEGVLRTLLERIQARSNRTADVQVPGS